MRNVISRTFTTVYADCVMYDEDKRSTYYASVCVGNLPVMTTTAAEKVVRKSCVGKLVMVEKLVKDEKLLGMTETDFLKYAHPVIERGKETRNAITKTVNTYAGDYVYMDSKREVKTRSNVSVPSAIVDSMPDKLFKYGKSIECDNEIFITFENLHKVSALYAISEKDFREHAREMSDHNHFKD